MTEEKEKRDLSWIKDMIATVAVVAAVIGFPLFQSDLHSAKEDVSELQTDVASVKEQVQLIDVNQHRINQLTNEIDRLELVIGDIKDAIRHALR